MLFIVLHVSSFSVCTMNTVAILAQAILSQEAYGVLHFHSSTVTAGRTPSSRSRVLLLLTQGFAEHTCPPTDSENWEDKDFADTIDPIEDFSEDDHMAAAGSMAVTGRSPKHPRTGFRDRNTHCLTEAQAREVIAKLRQGIGPDLDYSIARVGALRVRNAT